MAAASSTSPSLPFRFTLRQVVFGLPARFFSVSRSFEEDLSAFLAEFQVVHELRVKVSGRTKPDLSTTASKCTLYKLL